VQFSVRCKEKQFMVTKFSKLLSLLMAFTLLLTVGAGAALAQDATGRLGDGPTNALMPAQGVVQIEAGQWQWYAFRSQAPVSTEIIDEDPVLEDAIVDAVLRVQSGAVDFEVWSANDLNNWINDTDFDPTGVGTTNEFLPGDPLSWQGAFEGNNTYYLIVKNRSAQPSFYALNIMGNVAFPSTLVLNTDTPTAVAQAQPAVITEEMGLTVETPAAAIVSEPATTQLGMDAASAVMPASGAVQIEAGQWQWYAFTPQVPLATEIEDEDLVTNDATVNAALRVQSGNVSFQVWSADDLNNWRNGTDFDATGVGTTNESLTGDPLFWQGTFQGNNKYYLVVMNKGTQPAVYSLSVTGEVSFPTTGSLAVK
jgi:hypothetical protein